MKAFLILVYLHRNIIIVLRVGRMQRPNLGQLNSHVLYRSRMKMRSGLLRAVYLCLAGEK